MDVYLHMGHCFSVPTAVADHLLKLATHDQLKVLLYVLCHADETITEEQIAQACCVSKDTLEEALVFWKNVNVLQDTPTSAAASVSASPQTAVPREKKPQFSVQHASSQAVRPSDLAVWKEANDQVAGMLQAIEHCMGRMPKNTELQSFYWMNLYLGLDLELILMLVTYCVEMKACSVKYMERIAISWEESGITTHELAEQDLQRRLKNRTYTGKVMQIFHLKKNPTGEQQALIDSWCRQDIALELVQLAYEKTVNEKGEIVNLAFFRYANGILKKWQEAGVKTVADAEREAAAFQKKNAEKKKAASSAASYDLADLEALTNQF